MCYKRKGQRFSVGLSYRRWVMPLTGSRTQQWVKRAKACMPGGVNSPVRAFGAVGGEPVIFKRASGCRMYDVDGKEYIDFVASWGPMILGHAVPEVVQAASEAASGGLSFGATCPREVELAEKVKRFFPSIDLVRLVNSGTEATMSALRLARGFTGRDLIVKFEGCYHGHSDGLLAKSGSGTMTFGLPDSAGVPASVTHCTVVLPYNDIGAFEDFCKAKGREIAAVIVEPVAGNMGVVPPKPGFLEGLRELTSRYGIVLIFDEVITGFRLARGGAQELYGVVPDLTCLGKILGGGLPLAAYGGRGEIMSEIAPLGPVYQAGTLSGNPVAVAAGLETLNLIEANSSLYSDLEVMGETLEQGLVEAARRHNLALTVQRVGSMLTVFFQKGPVVDYKSAQLSDTDLYALYFRALLEEGIYVAPSQFEAAFLGASHSKQDLEIVLGVVDKVFARLGSG